MSPSTPSHSMLATAFLISFPVNFKLSRFRIIFSHHLVITLAEADGQRGVGSGVLYRSRIDKVWDYLNHHLQPQLSQMSSGSVKEGEWASLIAHTTAVDPGLAFALDSAWWDLRGKINGVSVVDHLGGSKRDPIPITEQVFIDDWARTQSRLRSILDRGTTRIKVKTGIGLQEDLALIRQVRQFVGNKIEIRIDGNRPYSLSESIETYRRMADLGVLAFEEPIRATHFEEYRDFREAVGLPVMLDESILTLADLQQAIHAQALDSLNIKLTRVGGLTQALLYRQLCAEAGVSVSLGCNEDLGPGMASILLMAATTADLYSTEGVGHLRLGVDLITDDMPITDGKIALPSGTGLGVSLHPDFPGFLRTHAHVFDLVQTKAFTIRVYHHNVLTRQRAANVFHRLRKRIGV